MSYYQQLRTQIGPISYAQGYYGPVGFWLQSQQRQSIYAATYAPYYSSNYSGFMSGGAGNPALDAIQRDFARAQRLAALPANSQAARNAIYDQWAYEKLGASGLQGLKAGEETPVALTKALAAAREADVASGEPLNHVMVAIVAEENGTKAAKIDTAYLPPNLLDSVRFSGSSTADAVNLLRRADKPTIPAVFDTPPFADVRANLEREFAGVAAPVLVGKAPDAAKLSQFELTVKKARGILDPLTKKLDFEDATAARRFLNQMDAVVAGLKGGGIGGLIDPRWATEGTNVADLVKYMTKQKLLFGPVAKGNEDAYLALHQGLVSYLYVLREQHKPAQPPKK